MDQKLSALILEQDPMPRDLMTLALENLGCEVFTTLNASEARRLLTRRQPQLLVVDTLLPKTNGLELIAKFQAERLLENTKIIVISALGFEGIVRQAAQLGIGAYLVKPVDIEIFITRARALLPSAYLAA